MKILIGMNLSPSWVPVLAAEGWDAFHSSSVGELTASDGEILRWARENHCVIFTHDLDFGTLLASKQDCAPSVVQLRSQETSPSKMAPLVLDALRKMEPELMRGAVVTIDGKRARARILPLF